MHTSYPDTCCTHKHQPVLPDTFTTTKMFRVLAPSKDLAFDKLKELAKMPISTWDAKKPMVGRVSGWVEDIADLVPVALHEEYNKIVYKGKQAPTRSGEGYALYRVNNLTA